jgi:hypothetical protein
LLLGKYFTKLNRGYSTEDAVKLQAGIAFQASMAFFIIENPLYLAAGYS